MENENITNYLKNTLKTTPQRVKKGIKKNNKTLNKRNSFNTLKNYIDTFIKEDTDNRLFIMPGLRGTGKTTLIYQLYNYLTTKHKINNNQILYLNLDRLKDYADFNLQEYLDLFITDINEEAYLNNKPLFIFIDESQYSNNWGIVGKIIFDEFPNVFLIFTGSDAINLEHNYDSARRLLKKQIYPLNFQEHLKLKYNTKINDNLSKEFYNLIFTSKTDKIEKIEKKIQNNSFLKIKRNIKKEWIDYIQYEEFPFSLNDNKEDTIEKTILMKNRIIEKDLDIISSFTSKNRLASYKILNILAMQKPGDISSNKLANILDISRNSVNSILEAFEKTQLLFSIKAYGSVTKRERQSREYYFLSTQIKSCICQESGQVISDFNDYMGNLSENHVASLLFKLKQETGYNFEIFYDSKKGGVDFLLKTLLNNIIPIEVGYGKKTKKQITKAINRYDSEYGIIISNTKNKITKDDNIIHIPLITFSLL